MARFISQKGFSAVEAGLMVAVIVLVGFIGYRVWSATSQSEQPPVAVETRTEEVPEIKQPADLDKAVAALDERQLDDAALDQLDAELNY